MGKLESGATAHKDDARALESIAISLKRIADVLCARSQNTPDIEERG